MTVVALIVGTDYFGCCFGSGSSKWDSCVFGGSSM